MKNIDPQNSSTQKAICQKNTYDLAIVGSGISCTYTLIHYISLIKKKFSHTPKGIPNNLIRVAVLDKSGEFWTGIPYGSRTGKQSLIITALKEFLPPMERQSFITWLTNNYDVVLHSLQSRPGIFDRQWLKSYEAVMVAGHWDELFLPRYIFGWYLKEQIETLLTEGKNQEYLECDLFEGEVLNVQKLADKQYQVDLANSQEDLSLVAEKIVLAIGSPPNKASFLSNFAQSEADRDICAIANMYEPSQSSNIETVIKFLEQSDTPEDNKVLIIGSNASALETLYSLNNISEAKNLISKFIVVSPNAQFPHRIYNNPNSTSFVAKNLKALIEQEKFTAKEIFEAFKLDIKNVLAQGETIDGTYRLISQEIITALNMLDFEEQKMFIIRYGVKIGKYQRRAGQDYLNVVDKLLAKGRLDFIKGKFIRTIKSKRGFEFINSDSQELEVYNETIKVVINCAGFQDLTKSTSTLIQNLVSNGVCTPNESKIGFEMTGDFEANENFYLMGPLVAGNINDKLKIWHAESCGRIFNLSQKLAEVLI